MFISIADGRNPKRHFPKRNESMNFVVWESSTSIALIISITGLSGKQIRDKRRQHVCITRACVHGVTPIVR